jgi:chromosome segregation ATPase
MMNPEERELRGVTRELGAVLALGEANALKLQQTLESQERTEANAIESQRNTRAAEAAAVAARHSAARSEQQVGFLRGEIREAQGRLTGIESSNDRMEGMLTELLERQRNLEVRQRNLESMLYARLGIAPPVADAAPSDDATAASAATARSEGA